MSGQIFGQVILWLIILAIVVVVAVYILRWLYRRSTKETAFVRTGFLGEKVVVNGGAFVVPVLHDITPVNMNVMRVEVRRGQAQTLGSRTLQLDGTRDLLEGRFASAMRTVAAQMTLEAMHEQRKDYAQAVKALASEDLAQNGLELESVAIVDLDQTSLDYFDPSNAFDAEGLTQLTETIEA